MASAGRAARRDEREEGVGLDGVEDAAGRVADRVLFVSGVVAALLPVLVREVVVVDRGICDLRRVEWCGGEGCR